MHQRAKQDWIQDGDKCTRLFFQSIKLRRKKSGLHLLLGKNGEIFSTRDSIIEHVLSFYGDLLGSTQVVLPINSPVLNSGPLATTAMNNFLLGHISSGEVKAAVFSMNDFKSPGPDGMNPCFYKKGWSVIGQLVVEAVQEFQCSVKLLKQINATVVTLIPKIANPSMLTDFRPISCCNVIYKVITKVLANRLKPIMPDIIDCSQSAFIAGRDIFQNICLAQELIRGYNRKNISPRCMLKIDLQKAFDTVNWSFLHSLLLGLGFDLGLCT